MTVLIEKIPQDVTEEELTKFFSFVGPVISVKFEFDQKTGKPLGNGICVFKDGDTAKAAVRILNTQPIRQNRLLRLSLQKKQEQEQKQIPQENKQQPQLQQPPPILPQTMNPLPIPLGGFGGMPPMPRFGQGIEIIKRIISTRPSKEVFAFLTEFRNLAINNRKLAMELLAKFPQLSHTIVHMLLPFQQTGKQPKNMIFPQQMLREQEQQRLMQQQQQQPQLHQQQQQNFIGFQKENIPQNQFSQRSHQTYNNSQQQQQQQQQNSFNNNQIRQNAPPQRGQAFRSREEITQKKRDLEQLILNISDEQLNRMEPQKREEILKLRRTLKKN
ncbi:cleavage stimulation factor 3' pre-RNA subunit [Anaeramoeba flamelloides]|uniref:Cleavage stimulation factor 3' pre-RNA subunit n=1 Tax=Anaeramoeba flamelloides TaxID=1746091 RepID=A0AAV7ZYB2_9EUKA|nr:cleavage stimulation factor 3' pre-RNA subunit [Anaeramoeba flamelloides]